MILLRHSAWLGARGSGLGTFAHSPQPTAHSDFRLGFSLIELIISLAILSVGLLGAMRVFPVGLRSSEGSKMSSRAAILAQRTLESLKLLPWQDLAEGESTTEEDGFEVTTRISQPPATSLVDSARLKTVEVTVRWKQDARTRELAFVTYLRRGTT